ncbi:MAG: hypothetical protein Q4D94_10860 [Bacillota bacterium]|nr:hypothetical protein [Bacillota bacterium]
MVSVEDKWWIILQYLTFDHICEALTIIGFIYFVIQRFIRHKAPVPKSAFGTVSKELLERCVLLLQKQERREYETYTVPEDILIELKADLSNEAALKRLLCSICAHMGIQGNFIKLIVQDTNAPDRAGDISTDLAFTTIRLELKPYYTLDTVIAVLAHEATHLHLYYTGTHFKDVWENEVLTDTAAVYCGFGEYMYKGYAVMQGKNVLSYQKVGYIKQEDVKYIMQIMERNRLRK